MASYDQELEAQGAVSLVSKIYAGSPCILIFVVLITYCKDVRSSNRKEQVNDCQ